MYRTLLVGLASDRVPANLSSSATRPQQAVSCGAIIINSAMTRKPAFTAYGTVPFYLAHLFFWFSPRLDAQAVGPSSTCRLSRLSGNATTGMIRFDCVVSYHIGNVLRGSVRGCTACIIVFPTTLSPMKRRLRLHGSASRMSLTSTKPCCVMGHEMPQKPSMRCADSSCTSDRSRLQGFQDGIHAESRDLIALHL